MQKYSVVLLFLITGTSTFKSQSLIDTSLSLNAQSRTECIKDSDRKRKSWERCPTIRGPWSFFPLLPLSLAFLFLFFPCYRFYSSFSICIKYNNINSFTVPWYSLSHLRYDIVRVSLEWCFFAWLNNHYSTFCSCCMTLGSLSLCELPICP